MPGRIGFEARKWLVTRQAGACGENLIVWPEVKIRNIQLLKLGNNVTLGERMMIQAAGGVSIGDSTIIGPGVKIWSANHNYKNMDVPVLEQGYEYKKVIIGKDVWLGANAIILPGTVLGDKVVVSAGAVVGAKQYPEGSVLMGNPARKISQRDNM
ncbi:MAG: acyltransferase [Thermodesulfobacteriota bacterium]|nr:acyltransferase [Thermodesulfobacteriota bacterium]